MLSRWVIGLATIMLGIAASLIFPSVHAAETVPGKFVYEGRLLDSSGTTPITTSHTFRFSLWSSADVVTGDVAGGAIDTFAASYGGWQEVHTVTPNADGFFSLELGTVTALPTIDSSTHLYLQVEAKSTGSPDTSYEILDRDPGDATIDRSPVGSVPYANNADMIDGAEVGSSPGDIVVLDGSGQFPISTVPGGTNEDTFILDANDDAATDIDLQLNVEENAVPLTDEEWVSRMDPLSTEQVSLDGEVYGLTIWDTVGGSWVVVYNKQIFSDNGIEVPITFDEFATACDTLVGAGITPIYEPISDGWHHVLWFAELGPIYAANSPGLVDALNANETKLADDSTMLEALGELNELYSNGCFGTDALSNEFANTESALATGEYAMTVNRLGLPAQIESAYPDASADNFGFFLMPLADNQIWNVNPAAPTKFIYSGSEHIDAAKAYFEFLTRPENLQYMLDNEEQFALLTFEGLDVELTADQQAFVDTYTEQGTVLQTAVNYVNPQWIEIGQDLTAMFTGAQTPEGVLETIDGRRADMANAAGDPAWE